MNIIPDGYTTVTPWIISKDTGRVRDRLGLALRHRVRNVTAWWLQQRVVEPTSEEMAKRPEFVEAMRYVQSAKLV